MGNRLPHLVRPLLVLLVCSAGIATADVVVLKNGGRFDGVITFEDDAVVKIRSEGSEWTVKREKIASVEKEAAGRAQEAAREKARRTQNASAKRHGRGSDNVELAENRAAAVIVYGTSWCGYCKKARAYFASRNIPFVDKDVETDPGANAEIQRKCAAQGRPFTGGVPVIDVYGRIIRGFDQAAIDRAISAYRD